MNKYPQPSVSTIGNFFTIASRFAIRCTPSANVTVTTIGKPSGMAATAKLTIKIMLKTNDLVGILSYLTPIVNISRRCRPCNHPTITINPIILNE